MSTQETFLGYAVEHCADDDRSGQTTRTAYTLTGPKGAIYGLLRNKKRPHLLFAISGRTGKVTALKGNGWFSDQDGTLRTVNLI